MNFGTIVFNEKIYNLDYMSAEELKEILDAVELEKKHNVSDAKRILKNNS